MGVRVGGAFSRVGELPEVSKGLLLWDLITDGLFSNPSALRPVIRFTAEVELPRIITRQSSLSTGLANEYRPVFKQRVKLSSHVWLVVFHRNYIIHS